MSILKTQAVRKLTLTPLFCILIQLGFMALNPFATTAYAQNVRFMASEKQELCLLKPQKKSATGLLQDITGSSTSVEFTDLKWRALILNSGRNLERNIDSYNYILPWAQKPNSKWISEHCSKVGYVTEAEFQNLSKGLWTSMGPQNFRLQEIKAEKEDAQVVKTKDAPSAPAPVKEQKVTKAETSERSWIFSASLISGVEFANGKGLGVTNELSFISEGMEFSLTKLWGPAFFFGSFRFIYISNSNNTPPTRADFTGSGDHHWRAGIGLNLSSNFSLALSYKDMSWLVYKRTTPTFVLESFKEEIELVALHFDWVFSEDREEFWGLEGSYSLKPIHISHEHAFVKDYKTSIYHKWQEGDGFYYKAALSYELNHYRYKGATAPSSLKEMNRNRYLLSLELGF